MDVRRLIPIGVAVTLLLLVVGVASHGRPLRAGSGSGPSAVFFDYVATSFFLLAVALVVVFVLILRTERTGRRPTGRSPWHLVSTLAMLFGTAAIALAITHSRFVKQTGEPCKTAKCVAPKPPSTTLGRRPEGKDVRNARLRWDEIAIVLAIVAGVGIFFYSRRAPRRAVRPLSDRRRRAVFRALDESIDDLRTDPDARRAIIAAYARMESALARVGLPRDPAETPFEYLERSLVGLDAGAPAARTLTHLFERAKFSQHEPVEAMRSEAIDALVAVRDALRSAAALPLVSV